MFTSQQKSTAIVLGSYKKKWKHPCSKEKHLGLCPSESRGTRAHSGGWGAEPAEVERARAGSGAPHT